MVKVILMVSANVIGDLIVLQFTTELWAVAAVTISTVLVGVFVGIRFLKVDVPFSLSDVLRSGWQTINMLRTKGLAGFRT